LERRNAERGHDSLERRLEDSRGAAFAMMVQAAQLSYFKDTSIAWQLRSSWFWSFFGWR
jgi:hypothetical protein